MRDRWPDKCCQFCVCVCPGGGGEWAQRTIERKEMEDLAKEWILFNGEITKCARDACVYLKQLRD